MDTDSQIRWSRRKRERPAEIMDAAMKVFAEKGYAGTRMEDIAKRAGVTKGTIYLYFDGKEAVFKTLVRETIGATLASIGDTARDHRGPAKNFLRFVLGTMCALMITSNRAALPKIIFAESGNFPELAEFYRHEIIDKGLAMLTEVFTRAIADGEFRPVDPTHAARLCVAPLVLSAAWRTAFARFDTAPYNYLGLLDTHLDILFRGLAPDGEAP